MYPLFIADRPPATAVTPGPAGPHGAPGPCECCPGTHWLFILPKKLFIISSLVLFNAANKSQRPRHGPCSVPSWSIGMLGIGAQGHRHIHGQSTSAPSAAGQQELGGDGEGTGVPHTPSPGGTQPWHPDTHTFPMALPPGTTAHGPGATCQGHSTCAGSTREGPGPPAPPEGPGSV